MKNNWDHNMIDYYSYADLKHDSKFNSEQQFRS